MERHLKLKNKILSTLEFNNQFILISSWDYSLSLISHKNELYKETYLNFDHLATKKEFKYYLFTYFKCLALFCNDLVLR